MENCIFCKIISKQIPGHVIHENEHFLAFLDIRPLNAGHTLIIPKKHYRWVWDIEEEYSIFVNLMANALKKSFDTNMVQSIVMGDEVIHAHIHLIPRMPGDGHPPLINLKNIKEIPNEEMAHIAGKIKGNL
jgi:histidine triad (HIT) family protein